jgi:hypothetical protein
MTQVEFNAWIRARFNLWTKSDVDAAIRKAVEAEREVCTQIAEQSFGVIGSTIALAIRARICIGCSPRNADGSCPSSQPEQEPVAWYVKSKDGEPLLGSEPSLYREEAEEILAGLIENSGCEIAPLYSHPQRTWVGLTGKEAMDVTRKEGHELLDFIYEYGTGVEGVEERIVAICKAIEAKLKEKNT